LPSLFLLLPLLPLLLLLLSLLQDAINVIEPLLKNTDEADAKVLYHKLLGDFWRYICEATHDGKALNNSFEAYDAGKKIASSFLEATHPMRLSLLLNYSVFCYETKDDKDRACDIAKRAFDMAISKLDTLDESSYANSTLVMQLLRDNLTLWRAGN